MLLPDSSTPGLGSRAEQREAVTAQVARRSPAAKPAPRVRPVGRWRAAGLDFLLPRRAPDRTFDAGTASATNCGALRESSARGWIKTKNRDYWRYPLESEPAATRRW